MARGRQGPRGVVAGLDQRISEIDRQLQSVRALMAERARLVQARSAITGETGAPGVPAVRSHVNRGEVLRYLLEHPGSTVDEVAEGLQAPLSAVTQHLHRQRGRLWEGRPSDDPENRKHRWYPLDTPPASQGGGR